MKIRCPNCKKTRNYEPRKPCSKYPRALCFYCGKNFKPSNNRVQ